METVVRKPYVDMAKGIGILLVILGHAVTTPNILVSWQCTFFMPLFFVCSGLCYTKPKTFKQNVQKTLYPYYVWGGIGFILGLLVATVQKTATIGGTCEDLVEFLLGMSMWNYPLWFLVAFFVCKCIFDGMMAMPIKGKLRLCVHITVAVLAFVAAVWVGHIRRTYTFFFPFRADVGLAMIPFMLLGFYSKQLVEKINNKTGIIKFLLAGMLLVINLIAFNCNTLVSVNSSDYGNPLAFFIGAVSGSYFIFVLCQIISRVSLFKNVLAWFGKNSLLIMCTHAIVLMFVAKLLLVVNRFLHLPSVMLDVFKLICCTLLMIPLCSLLNTVKQLRRKH